MKSRLQGTSLDDRFKRAEQHFKRGVYALAREEFIGILADGSLDDAAREAELRWRLAFCCSALGFTSESDQRVDEALQMPRLPARLRARLESVRGFSAYSRGEYVRAKEICLRAATQLRELGDHEGLSSAHRWLGMSCARLGDLDSAFENGYVALAEARHAGLEPEIGRTHGALASAFIQTGQYQAAVAHAKEALEVATRLSHQSGIIRNNITLSIATRLSGEFVLASTYAFRALAAAEESDSLTLQISARLAAGRALRDSGRTESAKDLITRAAELAQTSERPRDSVLVLEDLGDLELLSGNVRAALEKFRKGWRKLEEIEAVEGDVAVELAWRLGFALLELGDLEGSKTWIERGLEIGTSAGERKECALALRARALWNAQSNREKEARSDLEAAFRILWSLAVPYELGRTHLAFDRVLARCAPNNAIVRAERQQHLAAARLEFERLGSIGALADVVQAEHELEADGDAQTVSPPPRPKRSGVLSQSWSAPAFRATLDECRKLGPTNLPILLVGGTGTGKTHLAEAIHELGRGTTGCFSSVNCAALPDHLHESELFGHRKGAFTGAEHEHPGIFRETGRGTVFLDEIDKTSLEFQAKLLQVLDTRNVRPVGSTKLITIEARIVCATNRDLFKLVAEGKFLEDLHHRLICGVIHVPALRDRIEDLKPLSKALLEEICMLEATPVPDVSEDAWEILMCHEWPGNVRELKSLLHRAVALNRGTLLFDGQTILASAPLGSTLAHDKAQAPSPAGLVQRMKKTERAEILHALERAHGVRRKAALLLNISYRGLNKKMARLGIDSSDVDSTKVNGTEVNGRS